MYVTLQDLIIDKEIHLTEGEGKVFIGRVIRCPAPNHPPPPWAGSRIAWCGCFAEYGQLTCAWLSLSAAVDNPITMPPPCRCMHGGNCYFDENDLPKCK